MTRRRALAALVLGLGILATAAVRAPAAFAQDAAAPSAGMEAPVPPAAPAPDAKAPAPPTAQPEGKPEAKDPAGSVKDLEALLKSKPVSAAAMIVVKFGLFAAGIVLAVLALSRRAAIRQGLLPAPPTPPAPVVPLPLPFALLFVAAVYTLVMIAGRTLVPLLPEAYRSRTVEGMVAMAVPTLVAAVGVVLLRARARRLANRPPPPLGPSVRAGLWTFVVGSAAAVAAALVAVPLLRWAGREAAPQEAVLDAVRGPGWHVWLITAYGVLVAPFVEEALFRGLLHPAARARIGAGGAIVGVAVAFALIHTNEYAFFPLLVLALFLGWLLETTDSLVATFTVHALFNASSLLPILLFRYA